MNRDTNIFLFSYIIQNHIDKSEIDIYKLIRDYSKFLHVYESIANGGQNKIK